MEVRFPETSVESFKEWRYQSSEHNHLKKYALKCCKIILAFCLFLFYCRKIYPHTYILALKQGPNNDRKYCLGCSVVQFT
jgi:hypothetical protein